MATTEPVIAQAPFLQSPGPEILEDHVDPVGHAPHQVPPCFLPQVDSHRPLVAGDGRPPEALALSGEAPRAHRVALPGRLDLDDLGPVITQELSGEGTGDEVAQFEDPKPGQGSGRFGVGHGADCREPTDDIPRLALSS